MYSLFLGNAQLPMAHNHQGVRLHAHLEMVAYSLYFLLNSSVSCSLDGIIPSWNSTMGALDQPLAMCWTVSMKISSSPGGVVSAMTRSASVTLSSWLPNFILGFGSFRQCQIWWPADKVPADFAWTESAKTLRCCNSWRWCRPTSSWSSTSRRWPSKFPSWAAESERPVSAATGNTRWSSAPWRCDSSGSSTIPGVDWVSLAPRPPGGDTSLPASSLNVALYQETSTGGQLDLPDGRHQVLRLQGGGQSLEIVGTSGNFL